MAFFKWSDKRVSVLMYYRDPAVNDYHDDKPLCSLRLSTAACAAEPEQNSKDMGEEKKKKESRVSCRREQWLR